MLFKNRHPHRPLSNPNTAPQQPLIRKLTARSSWKDRTTGKIEVGAQFLTCAFGRAGILAQKREGDGGTPAGRFHLLGLLYRGDRQRRFGGTIKAWRLNPQDVWCDDPASSAYNQHARLPFGPSHEKLWRADCKYDFIIVLDYNLFPKKKNFGSAIFLHLTGHPPEPTAGCVAISMDDMRRLMPRLSRSTVLSIQLPGYGRPRAKNR